MVEGNISPELRLKNIDETRNYLIEEIEQDELVSDKHKKVCTALNYIEHFCGYWMYFNFCFCFFAQYFSRNYDFCDRLKICEITAGIKKYKLMITKKKKKHDKIVLLAKSKLNSIEVLYSKAFIGSNISHDEFVLINNALKEI